MIILNRAAALAAVALAVSCGRAADSPARDETAGAGPISVTASTSTGSTVTEHGIGPLRAGMTVADASRASGGALVAAAGADSVGCGYVQWRGGPRGVRVMVEGGRIARVDVDSAGIRTAAGVGIGDPEEKVQRLYGGRAVVTPQKYAEGHYLTVVDPADTAFALVFETSAGRVRRYRAGRRPQVEYVEGCG